SSLNIYDATNPTSAPSAQLILPANRPWGQTPPATDWDELQFDAAVAENYDYGIAMFQHYGWVSFKIENPAAPTALTLKKAVRFVNPDTGSRPKFARLFRGTDAQWYAVGSYLDGSSSAVSIVSMGADASNPQLVKSFTSTQVAFGDALETAQIAGQWWMFVKRSTGTTGLAIFDVSSAAGASEVAFIAGQASDYYVDQDSARLYILAATSPRTIKVVDIANPAAPVVRSTITLLAGTYSWVAGDGNVVVAAKGRPGLDANPNMQAFSVVSPTAPVEIAAGELNLSFNDDELLGDMAVILASNGNSRIFRAAYSMGTATTLSSSCLSTDPHPLFSVANQSAANATAAACGAADADGFPRDSFDIHDTSSGQIASGTVEITDEAAQTVFGPVSWGSGGTWTWQSLNSQAPGLYTIRMTLYDQAGSPYPLTKTIRLCGNPTAALSVTVDGQTFTTTGSGLLNEAATVSALGTTGSPAAYVLARQKPDLSIETFNDQSSTTWVSDLASPTAGDFKFGVAAKYAFVATDHATCSDALFASLNLGSNGTYDACKIVGPITAGYVVSAFRVEQPNGTAVAWDGHPGVVQITNDVTLRFTGKMATGYTPYFVWTIPNPPGGNVMPGSCSYGTAPYTNATCNIPGGILATQGIGQLWGLSVQACQGGIAGEPCAQPVQTVAAPPVTVQPLQQGWAFSVSPTSVNIGDEVTITLTQMVPTDGFSSFSFNVGGATCDGTTPAITCGGFFGTCTPGSTNVKFRYASGGTTRTISGTGTLVSGGQVAASTTPQVTVSSSGSCPVTCPTLSASISGPSSGIIGQNLTFTAVASGATVAGYSWSKDGLAAGTGSSLTTSFSTAATHRIDLTVSFSVPGGCTSSASTFRNVSITGGGGSTLTITPSKTTASPGENIVFSFSPTLSQNGDSVNVAFGDGGTGSVSYPCPFGSCVVTHAYASSGTFSVTASGVTGGTSRSGSTQVTIQNNCALPSAPVAAFTWLPTMVRKGQPVQFTDQSSNTPTAWAWQFGDAAPPIFGGGTSSQQHPSYSYPNTGTFTVKLTATNCRGSNVKQQVITVLSACAETAVPVADFDWAPKGQLAGFPTQQQPYVGQTVTLSDLSTNNPTAWHWYDFQGDPPTDFTTRNVTRTFSTAGNKNVRLTATNCVGPSTEKLKTLTVYPDVRPVTADFTVSTEPFQTGTPVVFTARTGFDYGDPTSFTWRFSDDPEHPVTGSSVQHTFSCHGTAQVTLTAARGTYNDQTTRPFSVDGEICGPESIVTTDAALVQGLNGTFWRTDLRAFNPSVEETRVYLAILPVGQNNADPFTAGPYHVPAKGTLVLNDILQMFALLGQSWQKAAIRLTYENVEDVAPIVVSRTYTNTTGGGTYGQSITGVPVRANTTANTLWLTGLHNDGLQGGFRTNFGLANLRGDAGVGDIVVRLYNAAGTEQTAKTFGLAPYGYVQDRVANLFGAAFESMGSFSLKVEIPQGVDVKPSASVVDNLTGDPVTVTGQVPPATRILVPSVARIRGEAGTDWHSDVQLTNPDRVAHTWRVEFLPKQALPAASRTITVGPAQSLRLQRQGETPDVVAWIYDPLQAPDASGVLRITSEDQSGVLPLVGARTYNLTASGTYGQGIPALSASDGAAPTGEFRELLITGMSSEDWARSNLGFVNLGTGNVNFEVYFYDEFGNMLNPGGQAYPLFLGPGGWDQDKLENRALNQWGVTVPSMRLISAVVRVTSGGPGFAYASVVDSLTGDPVFVGGQLAP
ncbi:MAG: PKD domain-containing protein, partial [Acidobacteria bacterium]|nr:PKD domain-containing protein [Acidobacteriota bacterium]